MSTDLTWRGAEGGDGVGHVMLAVANTVPSEIVKLYVCVACQRQAGGDAPASEPWQTIDATPVAGTAQYNFYAAKVDVGAATGDAANINYVGFVETNGRRVFDNNMNGGKSIRVDGKQDVAIDQMRVDRYGNRCGTAFLERPQVDSAAYVCGKLKTKLMGGQPDDGSPERMYFGTLVDSATQKTYRVEYKGHGALSGDYCVRGSLSDHEPDYIVDVVSVMAQ